MFILDDATAAMALPYHYDFFLVTASYLVAAFSAFASFRLIERIIKSTNARERISWLSSASVALGLGVWTMHFIAMLSVDICSNAVFDTGLSVLSITFAVLASGVALHLAASKPLDIRTTLTGGLVMGGGIGVMHYTGMASMHIGADIRYDPGLFFVSIVVAVALASVSLRLLAQGIFAEKKLTLPALIYMSAIMGLAITLMHYSGMAATYFIPHEEFTQPPFFLGVPMMAAMVGLVTILIITMALLATISSFTEIWIILAITISSFILFVSTKFSDVLHKILAEGEAHTAFEIFPTMAVFALIMLVFSFRRANETSRELGERKRLGKELLAAKEIAESASKAKSHFLSTMSHELRTPLNAILGFSEVIKLQSLGRNKTSHYEKYAEHIHDSGTHLLDLINDILDMSAVEAGKINISKEAVSLKDISEECLSFIRANAKKMGTNITITNVCACSEQPLVLCDRTRLKQVLINLLSNAVKYNRKNGSVALNCKLMPDGFLCIDVSDTGLGIPEDMQAAIFEPFNRSHAVQSGTEGTGLGLSITKKLVELMGGSIGFESKEGEGSTFWIRLPAFTEKQNGKNLEEHHTNEPILDTLS